MGFFASEHISFPFIVGSGALEWVHTALFIYYFFSKKNKIIKCNTDVYKNSAYMKVRVPTCTRGSEIEREIYV